ncbi:MAG: putative collagen-binding domain-containing protein, partial [Actinomycetota bacterium]
DDVHFARLRSRVLAAQRRGIYVSIMLFEGWCLRINPSSWAGHPMNAANNINGIDGDPNADGHGLEVQMLKVPAITELQRAYIRKVVDLANEFDNVLYEISNESLYHPDILAWQREMVRYVNEYQARKPKQHPVGMSNLVAGNQKEKIAANDALLASTVGWISPGAPIWGPGDPYSFNPPATTGKKVVILDTDHTWNNACMTRTSQQRADHAWVWKSFLRGYYPIYMDPLDLSQPDGVMTYAKDNAYAIVLARPAMGHTRAYAERMNLAAMTPRNELSSSQYCLANPGSEYLVYLPEGGEVTVDVTAAKTAMAVEWFNPRTAEKQAGVKVDGGAKRLFQAPFKGDAVLYLRGQ